MWPQFCPLVLCATLSSCPSPEESKGSLDVTHSGISFGLTSQYHKAKQMNRRMEKGPVSLDFELNSAYSQ